MASRNAHFETLKTCFLYQFGIVHIFGTLTIMNTKMCHYDIIGTLYMDIALSTINIQSSYTQSDNANRDLKLYILVSYVATSDQIDLT